MTFFYISYSFNILALLLTLIILLLPWKKRIVNETEKKLFLALIISIMMGALLGIAGYSMVPLRRLLGPAGWYSYVMDGCLTGMVIVLYHFVFQWMVYVDYRLYQSRDQLFRRYRILYVPLLIFVMGRIVIVLAGDILELPLDEIFQLDYLYYADDIIGFLSVLLSAILVFQYRKQKGHGHLFHILPVVIPIVIGYLINWFTGYSTIAVGDALGMVILYITMVRQQRYYDSSGFYSREYLRMLLKKNSPQLDRIRGAVLFENEGDIDTLRMVLREEMAPDDLVVRDNESRFVLFTDTDRMSKLKFLADMVESAFEEDESVCSLTTSYTIRGKDEDAETYLSRTVGKYE
ncbi:MAG: hypothetical protein IJ648_00240 [Lachnospiraceae bacterium]|nr:hypothetical protein [Lachnospiraceae bacterium]MBR1856885.1 hypothetical protein [Oribacterium sp.]